MSSSFLPSSELLRASLKGGRIIAVQGSRGCGKTTTVLETLQRSTLDYHDEVVESRRGGGGVNPLNHNTRSKRDRDTQDGGRWSRPPQVIRQQDVLVYVNARSFFDTNTLRRSIICQILANSPNECEDKSSKGGGEKGDDLVPAKVSRSQMGTHLSRFLVERSKPFYHQIPRLRQLMQKKGDSTATSSSATTVSEIGASLRRLHIVIDDADDLNASLLFDVDCWMGTVATGHPQMASHQYLLSKLVLWTVSERLLRFRKTPVWRHFVPPPSTLGIMAWMGPTATTRPSSSSAASGGAEGAGPQPVTPYDLRAAAIEYYSTRMPLCGTLLARNPKYLLAVLAESVLPALEVKLAMEKARAEPLHQAYWEKKRREEEEEEGDGGSSAPMPPFDPNTVKLGSKSFADAWNETVNKGAGSSAIQHYATAGAGKVPYQEDVEESASLLRHFPLSTKILFLACFYCGAVEHQKDSLVFNDASDELQGQQGSSTAAAADLHRRAMRRMDKSDGTLLASVHQISITRLKKIYEALIPVVQASTRAKRQHSDQGNLLGSGGGLGDLRLPTLLLGDECDDVQPFNTAFSDLLRFEGWGFVQWLANNRNTFYCFIGVDQAEVVAATVNVELFMLVPNAGGG